MSTTPQSELEQIAFAQLRDGVFPILVIDVESGNIIFANDMAVRALKQGFGWDNPTERFVYEMGYEISGAVVRRQMEEARSPRGHISRDRIFDTEGVRLLSSKIVKVGGREYLSAMLVDISEIIQVEQDRDDALARLQRAQEIARVGDVVVHVESGVVTGSAVAMEILRLREEKSARVEDMFAQIHPEDKGSIIRNFNDVRQGGSYVLEVRLNPETVGDVWIYVHATVEVNQDGDVSIRCTLQDITELKSQQREREQIQEKMQETQKLESLGLLAGGIAHDFNNILAGIMGNADFALLTPNLPAEVDSRLRDVVAASKRAADLTKQLLAYSGKGKFVIEAVNLSEIIREMAELLSVSSREHALRLLLDDNLPATEVDVTQIRQVIMNLIINAGEAIDHANGIISITTGSQMVDEAYLASSQLSSDLKTGEFVYVEVSDNGLGMSQAVQDKIFDPFFTTKFTGRGLGLAAAQGIVRGHNGAIKIYSEPKRGTTFKIFLPTTATKARALQPPEESGDWQGQGVVLVVDDDETVRDFVKNVLGRFGYEVLCAEDGLAGMKLFEVHADRVDVVLLDLTMPNLNGRETYAAMRKKRPGIATVLMSGYNEQDATQEFVGKGLAGFLPKPFLVADLMNMLERALANRSA